MDLIAAARGSHKPILDTPAGEGSAIGMGVVNCGAPLGGVVHMGDLEQISADSLRRRILRGPILNCSQKHPKKLFFSGVFFSKAI